MEHSNAIPQEDREFLNNAYLASMNTTNDSMVAFLLALGATPSLPTSSESPMGEMESFILSGGAQ